MVILGMRDLKRPVRRARGSREPLLSMAAPTKAIRPSDLSRPGCNDVLLDRLQQPLAFGN
jgi:hypothetical protein